MKWNRKLQMWVRNPGHRRSLGGLLMFIIMAPFLICVLACLKAPIGDPETSKVDSKLSGVWFGENEGGKGILVLQPFDKRTYLVGWFEAESDEETGGVDPEAEKSQNKQIDKEEAKLKSLRAKLDQLELKKGLIFKGWLTSIGGQQFMCWEPKFVLEKEQGMKPPFWWTFKTALKKDKLSLYIIDEDKKAGGTTREVEKFIKENYLDNKKFKDKDWMHFRKIDKSKYDEVAKALEKFGFSE